MIGELVVASNMSQTNQQPDSKEEEDGAGRVTKDGNALSEIIKKTLDVNKYATKKTIAQGLLDVALLTANASQLKYVLQVGEKHEFYTLMLTLITVSIVLQVLVGVLCLTLHFLRDCKLEMEEHHTTANFLNHITTSLAFIITVLNLLISCFDPTIAKYGVFEPPDVSAFDQTI